jgi:hypothetical protein
LSDDLVKTEKTLLLERLQYLWAAAANSCGNALPEVVDEIRNIEKLLSRFEKFDETP